MPTSKLLLFNAFLKQCNKKGLLTTSIHSFKFFVSILNISINLLDSTLLNAVNFRGAHWLSRALTRLLLLSEGVDRVFVQPPPLLLAAITYHPNIVEVAANCRIFGMHSSSLVTLQQLIKKVCSSEDFCFNS